MPEMDSRIPVAPPVIKSVPGQTVRPLWSVMIPVYNCMHYLEETLMSVLVQDPGMDLMQIEVIDDCSTDGNVQELVFRLGKGRVGYFKQPYNKGSLCNFETCLNKAQGHWVHLLHGDDKVKPGFYTQIKHLFEAYPQAGAAFTRHKLMDADSREYIKTNPRVGHVSEKEGIVNNWLHLIAQRNRLQPPAIVVKRSVYEHLGGFFAAHFGEDWEMWVRIATAYPVAYSPDYLAVYRIHHNNITSRSFTSGQTIKDIKKVVEIIRNHLPEKDRRPLYMQARKNASRYVISNTYKAFEKHGKVLVTLKQAFAAYRMHPSGKNLYLSCKLWVKVLVFKFRKKNPVKSATQQSAMWVPGTKLNEGNNQTHLNSNVIN